MCAGRRLTTNPGTRSCTRSGESPLVRTSCSSSTSPYGSPAGRGRGRGGGGTGWSPSGPQGWGSHVHLGEGLYGGETTRDGNKRDLPRGEKCRRGGKKVYGRDQEWTVRTTVDRHSRTVDGRFPQGMRVIPPLVLTGLELPTAGVCPRGPLSSSKRSASVPVCLIVPMFTDSKDRSPYASVP